LTEKIILIYIQNVEEICSK